MQGYGQAFTSAGGFGFFLFWFLTHLLDHVQNCLIFLSVIAHLLSAAAAISVSSAGWDMPALVPGGEAGPCLQNEASADTFIHSLGENREVAFSSARYYRMTQGRISYQGSPRSMRGGGSCVIT